MQKVARGLYFEKELPLVYSNQASLWDSVNGWQLQLPVCGLWSSKYLPSLFYDNSILDEPFYHGC